MNVGVYRPVSLVVRVTLTLRVPCRGCCISCTIRIRIVSCAIRIRIVRSIICIVRRGISIGVV
jgi:hypothetical protein